MLWPLVNSQQCIHDFLTALADGVVPVVIPLMSKVRQQHLRERYPTLAFYAAGDIDLPTEAASAPEGVFLVLMTSGSTGEPKLIATSAKRLSKGVQAIHAAQALDNCFSTYAILPLAYSFAFVNQLLWSLAYERQLIVSPGMLSPANFFDDVRLSRVDMLCFVGSQFRELQRVGLSDIPAMTDVKVVNFAGAPFPVELLPQLKELFPQARFFNNYGCTEAMPRIAIGEVTSTEHSPTFVGPPIDGMQIRILESDVGPVQFRGPSAAIGTINEDLSLQPFAEWIESGDNGMIDDDNNLHIYGRRDQILKIGGERISLVEIEQKLIAFGLQHAQAWKSDTEEYVIATVMGLQRSELKSLRSFIREELPRSAWPRELYAISAWPRLENGKTDRKMIQRLVEDSSLERLW